MIENTYEIFTHRPQSDAIANKNIAGINSIKVGINSVLKFLKKIIFFSL